LASAGLEILRKEIGSFASVTALVVGAGDTGALVSRLLRKAGVGRLIIANRTAETACEVAEPLDGEGIALEEIPGHLSEIDLAIGAATLSRHVLTPDMLTRSGGDAVSGPLRLLDLAHPRNFDPQIAEIEGVHLIDLDHVFDRVEQAKAARAAQLPQAEIIVKAKVEEFDTWFRSRSSINILRAVREHVLELAMDEAERFSRGRTDEEQEQMRRLARSLARTLLHHPTIALRTADPVTNDGRLLLESAPVLFGVQPQSD
jgi:glutamyl-tRNA reductase